MQVKHLKKEIKAIGPLPENIRVNPIVGDSFEVLDDILSSFKGNEQLAPSFVFCDPFGFTIPGAILRRLMEFPRVELFVNIIWRELDMAIRQGTNMAEGMKNRLDLIFDNKNWLDCINSDDLDERADQCADLFCEVAGARWATHFRMLGKNQKTRYFLLHLTNHSAGRDLMKECMWKVCPDGGFYARKTDDPRQQFLITPEPDLEPLKKWIIEKLSHGTIRWKKLHVLVRHELWLEKHVNEAVRELQKASVIVGENYEKRFAAVNNPLLRLTDN